MGELFFLGIIFVICCLFFFMTFSFPVSILDKSGGAGIFPRIVIIFLVTFVLVRIITILIKKGKIHFVFFELLKGIQSVFFFSIVLYILLFNKLGYVMSTLLFAYGTINGFFRYATGSFGSKKQIIIRNFLITAFVVLMYYFFSGVLNIILPRPFWS